MMFAFPPRQMRAAAAAHYLGLSESTFLDRVKKGLYAPGALDGGARVWLRDDLDRIIDRRFGIQHHASNDQQEVDPFVTRVAQRGGK